MSKLDDLINKLCPDGVEYRTLGEIAKEKSEKNKDRIVTEVRSVTNKNVLVNPLEIFSSQVASEDTSNYKIVRLGDFAYNPARINIGSIAYHKEKTPVIISPMYIVFSIDETKITQDFLLTYFLSSVGMTNICGKVEEGARFRMPFSSLSKIEIPVPPLEIQNEIVRILDNFTELEEELEEELVARRKQYEYYRDALLTFDDNVEWKFLSEVTKYSDTRIKNSELKPYTYVSVENLLQQKKGVEFTTKIPEGNNSIQYLKNDILIGNIRPYLRKIWLADRDGGTNGDVLTIRILDEYKNKIIPEYLFYILSSEDFFNYDIQYSKGAKMPRGSKDDVMKYKFAIPSIDDQKRIISILERFDCYCNDITSGLPAEIEARHKQYEYYRDKLLTFKRKEA